MILGFGFSENISRLIVDSLMIDKKLKIHSNENSIGNLHREILNLQPDLILGIGIHTYKMDMIRIENFCTNKYKNNILGDNIRRFSIRPFLKPIKYSINTNKMGNSYCNLISYRIMESIESDHLKSKFTFLHVPKHCKLDLVVSEINGMITNYHHNDKSIN